MATFSTQRLRRLRRAADPCVHVWYRSAPDALAELLRGEPQASPALLRGYALLGVGYTRFAPARRRWLPGGSALHVLTYRLVVERAGGARGSLVLRRVTSARRLLGSASPAFRLADRGAGLDLTVQKGGEEELHLRADPAGQLSGSVFASAREALELLESSDALDWGGEDLALEPLFVHAARSALLGPGAAEGGGIELDSAFRVVTRRTVPLAGRAEVGLRRALAARSSAPALPSP